MPRRIARWSVIAAAALSAVAPLARGQAAPPSPAAKGLDGLDEGDVRASMAEFGLTDLFNRDCDVNKIPADQRGAALAVNQLQRLANANLTTAQRRDLAVKAAKGLDELMAKQANPQTINDAALQLLNVAIIPAQNEVEYFGENPAALDALHTTATIDAGMFDRAFDVAKKEAAGLVVQLGKAPAAQQAAIQAKLNAGRPLKNLAKYYGGLVAYDIALATPKDDPERAKAAKAGLDALQTFDNPNFGIQSTVRLQQGKLLLTAGDTAKAKADFDDVVTGKVGPPPALNQLHDAHYFTVAADLQAGDRTAAEKDLADLKTWEEASFLPTLAPGGQDDVTAAYDMLHFRVTSAEADAAKDPADKQKLNADAINIVDDLLKRQPGRKDLVFDQMVARVPADADPKKLNTLILLGLQNLGFQEFTRWATAVDAGKPAVKVDAAVMDKALAAATEIVSRRGQPGVSDETADRAAYFMGYGLKSEGKDEAAATAFLDYAEHGQANLDAAKGALAQAEGLIAKLRKEQGAAGQPDEGTRQLYDRFLPLAINDPFGEKRLAYPYGVTLREERKYAAAAAAFALVPAGDKLYDPAQFFLAYSLSDELTDAGQAPTPEGRKAAAEQLQAVAPDVAKKAEATATAATGEEKTRALTQVASILYRAAVSARRDLKDPTAALKWLDGYEKQIAGVPNEPAFVQYATTLRVYSLMDLGKVKEATQVLVPLLNKDPVAAGEQLLALLQQVGRDLATAKANNDVAGERQLAQSQAQLTGFLVSFAEKSTVPTVKANLNQYKLFDASSKRQAGDLADKPAEKAADLDAALAEFDALAKLTAPAGSDKEAAAKAADGVDSAKLGVGLTQFDVGHYKEAKASLSDLLKRNKVGSAFTTDAAGQAEENPQFWEVSYKLIKSIDEVAKQSPADATAKTDRGEAVRYLKQLYVTYGEKTGGTGYKDEFTKLRAELAPDLTLTPAAVPPAAPAKK